MCYNESVKRLEYIYNQCFFSFQIIVKKSEKSGFFLFDFCKKEVIIIGAVRDYVYMNMGLYKSLLHKFCKVPPFL